ncbi:hypothetical protein BATDEDRAFT_26944 [Batrachochytrium dendrobatidis JAM81]|uniref:Ribosomal protein L10 n=2 Tax=Batrachochytrium dendrobatidis TaxID=109871 RepID=F4P9L6_BATDJ|nr:uncharacterized protein BATDEDRAFT_26944 [Batrachochytrium dendrobatidis JAM81]EGF78174.1 hypothetical protein BATDEDRAFT_26944 [Batrachochytrium dendrobatidis JAM81]OAJ44462.1 ribosomal protein L10 [Batrachochytrium dendrobatidis JEL423]|eukprot:XP_006681098.1 hypothetical protein BATDEDRAFT_26944 [Batrachochytrium dendrobatidis JAM81]
MTANEVKPISVLPTIRPAFHHKLPPVLVSDAMKTMKLSCTGNPPPPHRQFWYSTYKQIVQSRYVFILQNNNLNAQDHVKLRLAFRAAGLNSLVVRNAIFRAATCHVYETLNRPDLVHVAQLAVGPTMVVFTDLNDEEAAHIAIQNHLPSTSGIISTFSHIIQAQKKLVMVGGIVEGILVTADSFKQVLELPSLPRLRAELLGILQSPATKLVTTLQQTPATLVANLKQHEHNMM